MSLKNKIRFLFPALLLAFVFSTCDNSMGMGPYVDLEPASLKITGIVLPDGTEIPLLEDGNKLFVGPGILVGPGFYLKGTAWDNEKVMEITVEETGAGAEIVDGKPRMWTNAIISPRKAVSGTNIYEYDWSVSLDGISKGERNILVTVYDFPRNIGPNSVKQLTLLVDLDPPFIEKINIERQAGITVGLLPKTRLEEMDPASFENIDYFQNEYFTIRASISHNFSISGVTLNLTDENGNNLFKNGLERTAGTTVYAPSWYITAQQLAAANPLLASGRHYLKVSITARAEAGHSGKNDDKTNILYNLCWYPEADIPKMQMTVQASGTDEEYLFEKGNKIPVRVFDDDNVGEVYASIVTVDVWNSYLPSASEDEKLQTILNNSSNTPFPAIFNKNLLSTPARNTVVEVDAEETHGEYRLVVFTKDKKDSGENGVWGKKLFNIKIIEEGIPIITVESPAANTAPELKNGKNFTITGNVQNIDDLGTVKIAWVPLGAVGKNPDWDANTQGQQALLGEYTGVMENGIKIWEIELQHGTLISSKWKKQTFSLTVDIFEDFLYNGKPENESKLFIIYVKGKGGDDVFENFNVLPYSKLPTLNITPVSYHEVAPNSQINFHITAESPAGVQIEDDKVTLKSITDNNFITLSRNGDLWTGTTASKSIKANYDYEITAEDRLGFKTQQTITIVVTAAPELLRITSPHNSGVVFSSRDTITIQAVFDNPVTTVKGVPRLSLGGFDPSSNMRYATYSGGADTTTLNFSYKVQENDYTGVPGVNTGLTVTAFELNGGAISAIAPNISALAAANNIPSTKRLNMDGRAPKITSIEISGKGENAWHREGEDLTFKVTVDREIRVLGTPKLRLQFNGTATRNADFQTTENGSKTMVFRYKVIAGDLAEPVRIFTTGTCFTAADSQMITDTAGSNGNYLSLSNIPASTGTVNVDAVAPDALNVAYTANGNNPASKTIQIGTGNIEANATVEYTLNNGASWTTITNPYTIGPITAVGSYSARARQTDRAGNVSPDGSKLDFTISDCSLIAVSCDNPNGVYKIGDTLTFKLIFSSNVYGRASITIAGGAAANTGAAETINIPATALTQGNASSTLTASWTIPEGKNWNPLTITAITLNNVTAVASGSTPTYQDSVRTDYNTSRTGLKVLSIRPTISQLGGAAPAGSNTTTVLASANNTVTLTFDHAVWPEQGKITVRPAGGWHIPPVLGNDDYYKVSSALTGTNLTNLSNNYTKTTHGLVKSGVSFSGAPDTATKYVLNFSLNISDTTGTVNNVRTALEAAKYLWQEIETVSASQVTGAGTANITLNLDTLPNGRQWKIEIDSGAFRDEAGNTFAGWASTTDYRFWSAKTADPVIRVNRISNNRATSAQDANAPLQTNVQYRIDCETPGATISYNTWNRGTPASITTNAQARGVGNYGVATVATTMPVTTVAGKTAPYLYRAYPQNTDGHQNSNIADATVTELNNMMTTAGAKGSGSGDLTNVATFTATQTIGDSSYYTARKDYIAAIAVRSGTPALAISDRSYEGAFKTVLVFRNPTTKHATNGINTGYMNGITFPDPLYVKVEGTNLQNGAVTVSGFPLNVNDISGNSSKYLYQNGSGNNADRIWISWEVVCDFWQVYMVLSSPTLGTRLNTDTDTNSQGRNSWQYWPEMWYRWMYRKYGNWGLLDGHMSAYNQDYEMQNTINDYPWNPTAP